MIALVLAALFGQYDPNDDLPVNGDGYQVVSGKDSIRGPRVTHLARGKTEEMGRRWARTGAADLRLTSIWRSPNHPIEAAKTAPGDHATGRAVDVSAMSGAQMQKLIGIIRAIDPQAVILWQVPDHYDHLHVTWSDRPFESTKPKPKPEPPKPDPQVEAAKAAAQFVDGILLAIAAVTAPREKIDPVILGIASLLTIVSATEKFALVLDKPAKSSPRRGIVDALKLGE